MLNQLKFWMGRLLALVFLSLALFLVGLAGFQLVSGINEGKEMVNILIKSINTSIIALAIFELGLGIGREYGKHADEGDHTYLVIRRTIARFVGTVCIALVLEGLIMIIKYSQLDLAGNLYYPVGILISASVLLAGMGLFLQLTRADCEKRPGQLTTPHVVPMSDNKQWPYERRQSEQRGARLHSRKS
jgi:hypothetical protein